MRPLILIDSYRCLSLLVMTNVDIRFNSYDRTAVSPHGGGGGPGGTFLPDGAARESHVLMYLHTSTYYVYAILLRICVWVYMRVYVHVRMYVHGCHYVWSHVWLAVVM